MINTLDSRALGRADCYGQRFMKEGDYPYNIVPAHGHLISTDRPFVVRVKNSGAKSGTKQHNVPIACSGGKFKIPHREITIDVGDLVLWNCADGDGTPFAVVSGHEFFGSNRLVNECGFSHAFGAPGDYPWVDAYGSAIAGSVRVKDPGVKTEADLKRWQQRLTDGKVVMISDGKAQPADLEILTGQTVFFAVVKGPGISITDARLLDRAGGPRKGSNKSKTARVMRY
jgi:plastocyanin